MLEELKSADSIQNCLHTMLTGKEKKEFEIILGEEYTEDYYDELFRTNCVIFRRYCQHSDKQGYFRDEDKLGDYVLTIIRLKQGHRWEFYHKLSELSDLAKIHCAELLDKFPATLKFP